ncbi:hypothetical protein [Pedobacter paludis]|uniref:SIR2-like domain-containing protein n=1 Tax=Pedobacter paludis TaxID=2203212 RepID=A0A317F4S4_9SPHI|nr:hypothetical protein [Pedobacter paludis]PWS33865.1 hypothetical protein DF947_04450 [Pedobacter paludis]
MAEVAYLLGAGASAGALPIVSQMANEIIEDQTVISNYLKRSDAVDANPLLVFLEDRLAELVKACDEHSSVDTYAKKLYHTDQQEFQKLKITLSFYFTARQIIKQLDKRYDNFFASILQAGNRLPKKIKVLSWNYDFQLEASFQNFIGGNLDNSKERLNMFSSYDFEQMEYIYDKFSVIKLNGSARMKSSTGKYLFLIENRNQNQEQLLIDLVRNYHRIYEKYSFYSCELKFAWENSSLIDFIKYCHQTLTCIEVIVVIGYSFPFFNRKVDLAIFENLKNLKRIIIQDKNPEAIKEVLLELLEQAGISPEVILKSGTDQFFFPKELEIN